jgi:hypothetical protein
MKTAEQWQKIFEGETSLQSIKEIQTDALRHAASVAWQHKVASIDDKTFAHNMACQEVSIKLEREANSL